MPLLLNRFDERILLLYFGVLSSIIGRAAFFPFPGNDNEHVCMPNVTTTAGTLNINGSHHWVHSPSLQANGTADFDRDPTMKFSSYHSLESQDRFVNITSTYFKLLLINYLLPSHILTSLC